MCLSIIVNEIIALRYMPKKSFFEFCDLLNDVILKEKNGKERQVINRRKYKNYPINKIIKK